jgi:AraC-like DNA-binding protein
MNRGVRTGSNPHPVGVARGNWEILAVVTGSLRLVYPGGTNWELQNRRIWLLPPESLHSWATEAGQSCEVMVFHFASIHSALETSLAASRTLSLPLGDVEVQLLEALQRELAPHYRSPCYSSELHFEAAMLRLSALFLDRNFDVVTLAGFDGGCETVLRAERWHRSRMADGARVNDVAAAVGVSPSQLRRLFMRIRGESPKRVFLRAKLEEACRLMAQSRMNLKEVGCRCGFSGFSEFYRAFKTHTGQSPSRWRSNQLYGDLGLGTTAAGPIGLAELPVPHSGGNQVNSSAWAV